MTRAGGRIVLETARLALREFEHADAAFVVELLNQPSFLRFIGDKGVRTRADARAYLDEGPLASYAQHGFGLYAVIERTGTAPIGMCGLLRRPGLPAPDIGFAFLPGWWSAGLAREAAGAVLEQAAQLGIAEVLAVTDPGNTRSMRLLERIGMHPRGPLRLSADAAQVLLYSTVPAPG